MCTGWGGEEEDGCWSGISITHSGDGDPCGMRETLRLAGLVEDRELLLCWRKSGCVWSEYRGDTPNPGAGGRGADHRRISQCKRHQLGQTMDGKALPTMRGLGWGWGFRGKKDGRVVSTEGKAGVKSDVCPCCTWQVPLALNVVPNFNKEILKRLLHLPLKIRLVPNPGEACDWGHVHNHAVEVI